MMKHDSNMLINHEFDVGGIGKLSDKLNELLELRRKEKQHYQEKEALIADTYTNLSHDIRTPLTSLDGYFQLMEECENIEDLCSGRFGSCGAAGRCTRGFAM